MFSWQAIEQLIFDKCIYFNAEVVQLPQHVRNHFLGVDYSIEKIIAVFPGMGMG